MSLFSLSLEERSKRRRSVPRFGPGNVGFHALVLQPCPELGSSYARRTRRIQASARRWSPAGNESRSRLADSPPLGVDDRVGETAVRATTGTNHSAGHRAASAARLETRRNEDRIGACLHECDSALITGHHAICPRWRDAAAISALSSAGSPEPSTTSCRREPRYRRRLRRRGPCPSAR